MYSVIQTKRGDEIAVNGFESVINLLKENDRIFFRDGKIQLRVKDINLAERKVSALCYNSTTDLRTNCSCVFPDTDIIYQPIVDLDIQALERLRKSGLSPDWFALSFASDKASVKMMRDLAEKFWLSKRIKVMAKIETKKGIDHIKEILQESDGIMVARGDLLLHIPPVKLPRVQEYLVEMAKKYRKVSVVATEFLEIFATTGIVNRAELSDIALGARQKATALMLSMESANSHYSKECLELMAGVIDELYERKE